MKVFVLKTTLLFYLLLAVKILVAQHHSDSSAVLMGKQLFTQKGQATFYARKFEGRRTANGEHYHRKLLTAAHRTLPFNTKVKVTNPYNGRWVIVRINDRGPYKRKRIIDLSERAARHLGIMNGGHAKVIIHEVPNSSTIWHDRSRN